MKYATSLAGATSDASGGSGADDHEIQARTHAQTEAMGHDDGDFGEGLDVSDLMK